MAEEGFEVQGAHEHAVEHATEHGGRDSFVGRVAVSTAVIATIGAIFSYLGGATQTNAGLYKSDAASKRQKLLINGAFIKPKVTARAWRNWA